MDESGHGRADFGTGLRAALARARERRAAEERPPPEEGQPPEDRAVSPELALVSPDPPVEGDQVVRPPDELLASGASHRLARLPERNNPA